MATTEVEATLALVSFIQEVNVYGVAVPGESHQHPQNHQGGSEREF